MHSKRRDGCDHGEIVFPFTYRPLVHSEFLAYFKSLPPNPEETFRESLPLIYCVPPFFSLLNRLLFRQLRVVVSVKKYFPISSRVTNLTQQTKGEG